MRHDRYDAPAICNDATVFVVFELSKSRWQLGIVLPGSRRLSRRTVAGGDVAAVWALISAARAKAVARTGGSVEVVSAYEAGFDGFWLHRWLEGAGAINHVLDPASILVNRRARRAKTDRLDVPQLMRVLVSYWRGDVLVCRVARPPTVSEEDAKRLHRERQRLVRERVMHTNRIKGLLHGQGVRDAEPLRPGFLTRLAETETGDGRPLPPRLLAEIRHEHERLELVRKQIAQVEAEGRAEARQAEAGSPASMVARLTTLRGIGEIGARLLVHEAFYRRFTNRREVGGYFGLDGTPYNSGQAARDQGISKAGNPRGRAMAVELSWLWLRHQPDSALSRWFFERVGTAQGRVRRIAIVALARKLMVALWRFLETGVVPEGAVLKPAARG